MGRLYWKIFLGYWAVAVVVAVVTSVATNLMSDYDAPRRFNALNELRLESSAVTAQLLLGQGGPAALRDWLQAQGRESGRRGSGAPLWVIGPGGRDLLGRHVPRPVLERLQGEHRRGHPLATQTVTGPKGGRYVLVLPAPDIRGLAPARRPLRLTGLVVAIAVSGFVCWLLAGYLIRPLRQLQVASRRLGAGERGVRVAQAVGRRRDEIGELGTEFNHMAAQLERSMDAQAALLRDVSHELRSPLARLRVALDLARRRAGGAQAELDRIDLEAGRLDALIGQLLEMIRMRAGDQPVAREAIDLAALLAGIVDDADFEAAADDRSVHSVESDGGPPVSLQGDGVLLGRAFENIIRNGVLHTAENTAVEVTVSRGGAKGGEGGGGDWVVVAVRDHGPGVPEAVLTRLFDPFFRVEEARDRATGGHGLGLAIAREAVRLHGGEIWAENAEAGGLRVSVRLPVSAAVS
ncbi:MAG: HAMP domain-containing sensor histidine kinase [Alphaproteobacteria bacterium]